MKEDYLPSLPEPIAEKGVRLIGYEGSALRNRN